MRLRWSHQRNAGITGYYVYVQRHGSPVRIRVDARLPPLEMDGTLAFEVSLLRATTYYFEVSAYAGGDESRPSNLVQLGYAQVASSVDSDGDGLSDAAEDVNLNEARDADETDRNNADSDRDGVHDAEDSCEGTAAGIAVNGSGCSCAQITCTNGNACDGIETCVAGICYAGAPADCDDGNPCTTDTCDPIGGQCAHLPGCCSRDGDCTDADACTVNERCVAGSCLREARVCDDAGPCAHAACTPVMGCTITPLPDGSGCADGDPCAPAGVCIEGTCQPAADEGAASAVLEGNSHLEVKEFLLRRINRRAWRLEARASFAGRAAADSTAGGVTLTLRDSRGIVLYGVTVPGSAFLRRRGRLLYLADTSTPHGGLKRLEFRQTPENVQVRVRATVPAIVAAPTVTWVISFGDSCLRSTHVMCESAHARAKRCT